jgi:hypothetical protein
MKYLYRRRIMLVILIISSLLSVRLLSGCGEGLSILTDEDNNPITGIDWSEWSYRRSVTISNSGTGVTEYQVNVTLDSGFTYTNAASDGSDIRFNYGGISIPYWIESWNAGTSASIWVKVPSIPNGGKVIYMYYGRPGETAASNFDNTFTKDSGFSGLVARWHIDEGSGSSIDDSSSNLNDGTITGATWVGADGGRWYTSTTAGFSTGNSLIFNGSTDYVTVADSSSLDVTNITIAAGIKTGTDVSTTQYIVSKWIDSDPNRSYAIGIETSKFIFLTSSSGTLATIDSMSIGSVSTNTWYHFLVTSDGSNKRVYINGTELTPARGWANSIHSSNTGLTIGNLNNSVTNYFTGIIDEVSIYNRALSADEVKALSQRRKDSTDVGDTPTVGSEETVP